MSEKLMNYEQRKRYTWIKIMAEADVEYRQLLRETGEAGTLPRAKKVSTGHFFTRPSGGPLSSSPIIHHI
ncbi:MAG: hypothetical protein IJ001_01645 [Oscillospiraceae bacterium]|nr:hypothetical protein [Oscillospiraceae bacterium]